MATEKYGKLKLSITLDLGSAQLYEFIIETCSWSSLDQIRYVTQLDSLAQILELALRGRNAKMQVCLADDWRHKKTLQRNL
jgi:hypothetical protein